MNGKKEVIRDVWIKTEDTVRRNKKAAIIAVGAITLVVAGLFFYGSTTIKVHADEHENEKARETHHPAGFRVRSNLVQFSKSFSPPASLLYRGKCR